MERREAKRVRREFTPEEKQRVEEARRLVATEKDEILAKARKYKAEYDASHAPLSDALGMLKAERIRQGLSLADLQERTGIERSNLSKLESEADLNPTVATLSRYAEALGKKLVVALEDR